MLRSRIRGQTGIGLLASRKYPGTGFGIRRSRDKERSLPPIIHQTNRKQVELVCQTKTDPIVTRLLPSHVLPKRLNPGLRIQAAQRAVQINPVNHAPVQRLASVIPGFVALPEHIAVLTTKYWGTQGVRLTVSFLDGPEAALRSRILQHMNAWNATANALFVETSGQAQVRIARQDGPNGGFWSLAQISLVSRRISPR